VLLVILTGQTIVWGHLANDIMNSIVLHSPTVVKLRIRLNFKPHSWSLTYHLHDFPSTLMSLSARPRVTRPQQPNPIFSVNRKRNTQILHEDDLWLAVAQRSGPCMEFLTSPRKKTSFQRLSKVRSYECSSLSSHRIRCSKIIARSNLNDAYTITMPTFYRRLMPPLQLACFSSTSIMAGCIIYSRHCCLSNYLSSHLQQWVIEVWPLCIFSILL